MPTHAEKRAMPYSPEQLFALVAQVDRYPEFLPWCIAARLKSREGDLAIWDLVIGFRMIRERFTSRVTMTPAAEGRSPRIDVSYADGPFRYLNNHNRCTLHRHRCLGRWQALALPTWVRSRRDCLAQRAARYRVVLHV
jgi:coenzyme Q-binding protein COQ10